MPRTTTKNNTFSADMLSENTVPQFYWSIKTTGVSSREVVVQKVAVADDISEKCTAIQAAAIEEENVMRVFQQKQQKLLQFQSRLNAR